MVKWMGLAAVFVVAALIVQALLHVERPAAEMGANPEISIAAMLATSADTEFAAVEYPRAFTFPADHAQHSEYRTEWWNLSGALADASGTPVGLHVLLMRIGIGSQAGTRQSRWATNEIFAGVASLSHPFEGRLATGQRLSRGALGLAGTSLEPVRFWVEDWRFEALDAAGEAGPGVDLHARLAIDALELELQLENSLPLLDTNAMPGLTSGQRAPFQFYLQPRLHATGTLRGAGGAVEVAGSLSFEHAWGELPLPGGPIARDRMTLYLDDQRVIVIVVTHRADGTGMPEASGALIDAAGRVQVLAADDLRLVPADHWRSPRTGARYPIGWTLQIHSYAMDLELVPDNEDQEGNEWTPFWSGPIRVLDGRKASIGTGIMQLYGYDAR